MSSKEKRIEQAKSIIKKWDNKYGESWSNDSDAIALVMIEFAEQQKSEIFEIIDKNTRNRKHYKGWERLIMDICEELHGEH